MKLVVDSWMGKEVFVKENFIYTDNGYINTFKKDEKFKIEFNNAFAVIVNGCVFSIDLGDNFTYFFEHFYTIDEMRNKKLNKLGI